MRSISSRKSDRVKELVRLHKKSDRHEAGLFLAEGPAVVRMALDYSRDWVVEVFAVEGLVDQYVGFDCPVTVCSPEVIAALSGTQSPQGVIALCRIPEYSLTEIVQSRRTVVVMDNISDPGNLGTIIRTADATAAAGVLLYGNCVDPYNDKVVRSSAGSIFRVPIATLDSISDLPPTRSVYTLAADADLSLTDLEESHRVGPQTWVIGSEAHGISPDWSARVPDPIHVSIPMADGVESLNAAIAASICLYEQYLHRPPVSDTENL